MRRLGTFLLFFLIGYYGFAQTGETANAGSEKYESIAGSPYFMRDWADGVIRFSSGKVTDKFKLKFNVVQNRLMLQFKGSTFAAESKITEFVMYSRNKSDSFVFRKGFPDSDRGNRETYYRVLEEGRVTLIELTAKDILEEKEILSTKPSRHFRNVEQFYVFRDGTMNRIDKEKNPVENILSDKQPELKAYIAEQQLKMRSAEDLIKVVRKYNELGK